MNVGSLTKLAAVGIVGLVSAAPAGFNIVQCYNLIHYLHNIYYSIIVQRCSNMLRHFQKSFHAFKIF